MTRKLAAVLYADVAGYSRLTGEDETGTHTVLSDRLDAFALAIEQRGGRVGHFAGDAILAEFPSVVEAISCAVEAQRQFCAGDLAVPENRRVRFRIGVNLGDVIADRGEVYGDGVNVAARLEALADPGGICISESVRLALGNKLPLEYEDIGEQRVKNIASPIRAYRIIVPPDTVLPPSEALKTIGEKGQPESRHRFRWIALTIAAISIAGATVIAWVVRDLPDEEPTAEVPIANPRADKPGIVILPFENLSADPEQEYFADGMSHDLMTDLSQISGLFVIARHSAFAYKGTPFDIRQIGQDLGVRYVLEGSVRKAGNQVRINAQLTDTRTGGHIWAERYDRQLDAIFDLQDEVTGRIVSALAVKLTKREQDGLARRYTDNAMAYDYFLQGQERYFRFTEEDNARARELYRIAIELDPEFARAYGALAVTYGRAVNNGWSGNPEQSLEQGIILAERALSLDDRLPQVHWARGFVYLLNKEHDRAIDAAEQAVRLDANFADGYGLLAWIHTSAGRPDVGIDLMERAMSLDPHAGGLLLSVLGEAQYWEGRLDEAVSTLQRVTSSNPNDIQGRVYLAATLSRLGRQDEAEWEVQEVLVLNPAFSLDELETRAPIRKTDQLKRLIADLRRAGFE